MKPELFDKISAIVTSILGPMKGYLVDLNVRGESGSSVLEIYVDTDEGITADQCAVISRGLSLELDAQDILTGRYRLEVSSPGLDRPLKLGRQFAKNIGRTLRVISAMNDGKAPVTGVLQDVTEASLTILTAEKRSVSLALLNVQEAYVLPELKKRV
jgi:ribosome maturation factor RimP